MTLNQLEDFLFWLAILMAVLTVVIIAVYFWKTRYWGGNYFRNHHGRRVSNWALRHRFPWFYDGLYLYCL